MNDRQPLVVAAGNLARLRMSYSRNLFGPSAIGLQFAPRFVGTDVSRRQTFRSVPLTGSRWASDVSHNEA